MIKGRIYYLHPFLGVPHTEMAFGIFPVVRIPPCILPVDDSGEHAILCQNIPHVEVRVGENDLMIMAMDEVWEGSETQAFAKVFLSLEGASQGRWNAIILDGPSGCT